MSQVWFKYVCTECDFTMLLPDDGKPVPDLCPDCECIAVDSPMYMGAREVAYVAAVDGDREGER